MLCVHAVAPRDESVDMMFDASDEDGGHGDWRSVQVKAGAGGANCYCENLAQPKVKITISFDMPANCYLQMYTEENCRIQVYTVDLIMIRGGARMFSSKTVQSGVKSVEFCCIFPDVTFDAKPAVGAAIVGGLLLSIFSRNDGSTGATTKRSLDMETAANTNRAIFDPSELPGTDEHQFGHDLLELLAVQGLRSVRRAV